MLHPFLLHKRLLAKTVCSRAHLKNKREPFAITLITRKMYFIVDPADAAEVYKNAASFAFDRVVQQLQRTFGISEGTMMATWGSSKENDSKSGSSKARDKNLGELSMEFWRTQLVRQEGYSDIESKLFQHVSAILDQQVSRAEATGGEISLSKLTTEVIIGAALRAFFGESLLEMQPDLVETYVAFDKESWKLWFRWPFSKSMYAKKAAVEDSLRKWITLPQERRLGRSYIVKMVEQTQRALGTPDPDLAKIMNLLVYVYVLLSPDYPVTGSTRPLFRPMPDANLPPESTRTRTNPVIGPSSICLTRHHFFPPSKMRPRQRS